MRVCSFVPETGSWTCRLRPSGFRALKGFTGVFAPELNCGFSGSRRAFGSSRSCGCGWLKFSCNVSPRWRFDFGLFRCLVLAFESCSASGSPAAQASERPLFDITVRAVARVPTGDTVYRSWTGASDYENYYWMLGAGLTAAYSNDEAEVLTSSSHSPSANFLTATDGAAESKPTGIQQTMSRGPDYKDRLLEGLKGARWV